MSKQERLFGDDPVQSYTQSTVGQIAHERIEEISNRAQSFAEEKKEALYQKFNEGYARLMNFSKNGHWTWQTICFLTALITLLLSILSFLNIFSIVFSPFQYILNAYVLLFSLILVVYEFPKGFSLLTSLRDWCDVWLKAFNRLVGRGFFYIFIGTIVLTAYGWIGYLVGVVVIVVGFISVFIGLMLSKKLRDMRRDLQERFGNDFVRIQEQFSRFDTDRNGFIDANEFGAMCAALGLQLTASERDYVLNLLDKDHDGVIDIYEFSAWYNSRNKEYV